MQSLCSRFEEENRRVMDPSEVSNEIVVELDCSAIAKFVKLHEHLKTHMKRALIHLSVGGDEPAELSFLTNMVSEGLIKFKVPGAVVEKFEGLDRLNFIVRNVSFGNTFMISRELFGENIAEASFKFYRQGEPVQNFMVSSFRYTDGGTKTHHRSLMDDWNCQPPKPPASSLLGKVILSNKTCVTLQKWARSIKLKNAKQQAVVIFNKSLSVVVISVDKTCGKTFDFNPLPGEPAELTVVEKREDVGCLMCDASFSVGLDAFVTAICACKISSLANVGLTIYDSHLLGVEAVPLKQQAHHKNCLSVFLVDRSDERGEACQVSSDLVGASGSEETGAIVRSQEVGKKKRCLPVPEVDLETINPQDLDSVSEVEAAVASITVTDIDSEKSDAPPLKRRKTRVAAPSTSSVQSRKSAGASKGRAIFNPIV